MGRHAVQQTLSVDYFERNIFNYMFLFMFDEGETFFKNVTDEAVVFYLKIVGLRLREE